MENKNKKYFIYDECNKILLENIINNQEHKIFNFRKILDAKYKKIFFFIKFIIQNFFSIKKMKILIKEGFFIAFAFNEIQLFNPNFVITTTDNDLRFYLLKQYFDKTIKFVAIQNGIRTKLNDFFDNPLLISKKNLSADYYCSFGYSIKDKINKYINVKVVPVGSFKNNHISIKKKSINYYHNNQFLYISSFRKKNKLEKFHISSKNRILSWKEFVNEEIKLIKILKKYCIKNNFIFSIAGSSQDFAYDELKFYKSILGNCRWKYYYRDNVFSNYKLVDNFEIIVNICSTLGYEALARNKKVAFFSRNISPFNDWIYGWPDKRYSKGFFYSNVLSFNEISRVINNLRRVRNPEWKLLLLNEKNRNMHFNFGNNKLKNILK